MIASSSAASPRREGAPTAAEPFSILRVTCWPDTVLVEGAPSSLADLHTGWPVDQPDVFHTFASGSLGWRPPASVGVALAERDSRRKLPVVVIG